MTVFKTARCVLAVVALAGTISVTSVVASAATTSPATGAVTFVSVDDYLQRWGQPTADRIDTDPGVAAPAALEPPGGGSHWWSIIWDYHDLRGTSTPVRWGSEELGYAHYAQPHNLLSNKPIQAAFQTHKPDKAVGAHLEYIALAVDPANGTIYLTIRVIVQAAIRTDDGKYRTPDGKNIGVVTAYCEGHTVCPAWVNTI